HQFCVDPDPSPSWRLRSSSRKRVTSLNLGTLFGLIAMSSLWASRQVLDTSCRLGAAAEGEEEESIRLVSPRSWGGGATTRNRWPMPRLSSRSVTRSHGHKSSRVA